MRSSLLAATFASYFFSWAVLATEPNQNACKQAISIFHSLGLMLSPQPIVGPPSQDSLNGHKTWINTWQFEQNKKILGVTSEYLEEMRVGAKPYNHHNGSSLILPRDLAVKLWQDIELNKKISDPEIRQLQLYLDATTLWMNLAGFKPSDYFLSARRRSGALGETPLLRVIVIFKKGPKTLVDQSFSIAVHGKDVKTEPILLTTDNRLNVFVQFKGADDRDTISNPWQDFIEDNFGKIPVFLNDANEYEESVPDITILTFKDGKIIATESDFTNEEIEARKNQWSINSNVIGVRLLRRR